MPKKGEINTLLQVSLISVKIRVLKRQKTHLIKKSLYFPIKFSRRTIYTCTIFNAALKELKLLKSKHRTKLH